MPSRSMSSRRAFGSVMPGRSRLFSFAVPFVSLMPTPGRLANCFLMRSRRSSHCGWKGAGMRACQLGRSPPCPSASMTWVPKRPMGLSSMPAAELEDAARQAARLQVLQGAIEVVEGVAVGDQLVEAQPAGEVEVGEHREVAARPCGAVAAAENGLVVVEAVHHQIDGGADARHADDGERPAGRERVERLPDDGEVADALEGVLGAAA